MDLDRDKVVTILGIVGLLLGLLVVPPVLQYFYGINAIASTFVVIVVYAVLNYWMQRRGSEE